ncbi:hypothetical protein F6X40_11150 [Paraburkholderia sp. UCT31]|uniref:hypothetical protein n=1 Tax=Paraburkholderia sp. UCT31 TaxID=2615209 RepID=UPI001655DE8D|nr:hypothetical protein [Paraburkholderia sp. UCT31]MBC8737360.1 hypothetical protein [Paraburkholderia sp. UCT31]
MATTFMKNRISSLSLLPITLVLASATASAQGDEQMKSRLSDSAEYIACVVPAIPRADRVAAAKANWPAPMRLPGESVCAFPSTTLAPGEAQRINQLTAQALEKCASKAPLDPATVDAAQYGILAALLISADAPPSETPGQEPALTTFDKWLAYTDACLPKA